MMRQINLIYQNPSLHVYFFKLKSLNQLIESEHAIDETNGCKCCFAFHACREETEAIIRGQKQRHFVSLLFELFCIVSTCMFFYIF